MRLHALVRGLRTLAWTTAFACASAASVPGAPAAGAPTERPGAGSGRRSRPPLVASRERADQNALRLGRAVMEQTVGNRRGVVENLEAIDFSREPTFAEADRAAFLLGQAYLGLGSTDRFVELARQVARWQRTSTYTECLVLQLRLAEAESVVTPGDSTGTSSLSGLASNTRSAALARFEAIARAARSDEAALTELAGSDTSTSLGRDLAGAALIRLATLALEREEDARPLLERVPAGTRHSARARHMLGLIALERGEHSRGEEILKSLLADDSTYAGRREAMLALAGRELDRGRWLAAQEAYQEIDREWTLNRDALKRMLRHSEYDTLWLAWRSASVPSDAVILDGNATRAAADGLASASLDLTARPSGPAPALEAPAATLPLRWSVSPPPAEAWGEIAASERAVGEAAHDLERARWNLAREREFIEQQRRYLMSGSGQVRREAAYLQARAALLDSLRKALDALDAQLQGIRDESTRRVVTRTSSILEDCANSLRWMSAMRRFHVEGPNRDRATPAPAGFPAADSMLAEEEELAHAIQAEVARMARDLPGLIDRSYRVAWRPNLIERAAALELEANRALAWARALNASIDSSVAAAGTSETLQRLAAEVAALEKHADSVGALHAGLRDRLAREAVERALAALEPEREAVDYGLGVSSYSLAVRLPTPDAADSNAMVTRSGGTADSSQAGAELDDPESVRWRSLAVAKLRSFLARHEQSTARGEMRFRLADLLLVEARSDFRARMARFMKAQEEGRAGVELPVLSYGPALELYRAILAEDREFAQRDAVLFNAGMILADEANPEAAKFFEELVTAFPQSPYVQESYLRMGDMQFMAKRYRDCVPLYEKAAAGPDAGLKAVALYKLGWAHFNEDRFLAAADAFREVLDLYASGKKIEIQADVESEAESYLMHSLAGAGGARAFAEYFDKIGSRPYERRVLMALGQHFRRIGMYGDAVASDQLFIRRYPNHADALVSARRLTETYERWDRPDLTRDAQLEFAPQFAPKSGWAQSQSSDSVRTAGGEFARTSLKTVALHHHKKARATGSQEDWKKALELYMTILTNWPRDPEAPTLDLHAGEAGAKLGEYKKSLSHYDRAARSGTDSIATQALWQRVAVTDAWYESTRPTVAPGRPSLGRNSLAGAVLVAGDELLERVPNHPEGANITWRQGNLSYSHTWYDRAALDFGRLATRYPRDPRKPRALGLRADALFNVDKFEAAGAAYEEAHVAAKAAGMDSLARRALEAVPICAYRHAESMVAADSSDHAQHARLFEKVAARWPAYEHAHAAQYRAGLAYQKAGSQREAIRAMEALIRDFPKSEYVKDAHIHVAKTWEELRQFEQAGQVHARFAERFPEDPSAKDAWLRAADLYDTAGVASRAEKQRLDYIAKYPDDVETAMEILETLARRDLATISAERPISRLLPAPKATTKGQGAKGKTSTPAVASSVKSNHLATYLERAKSHPKLASRSLLAQVEFLHGEEANTACAAARLSQPLQKSLPAKQKLLDAAIARYRKSVDLGESQWAHASAYRIGEALVAFGEAIEKSERPADLTGDDLLAYQDVLVNRSQAFYDRGENVWAELLRTKSRKTEDEWISRTQKALWPRVASRFFFRPEADFPLVAGQAPVKSGGPGENSAARPDSGAPGEPSAQVKPEVDQP